MDPRFGGIQEVGAMGGDTGLQILSGRELEELAASVV